MKSVMGVCLCIYVFRKNNIQTGDLFHKHTISLLLVLIFYQIVIFILSGIRWVLIVRSLTTHHLTFKNGLLISWVGQFFSSFLPSLVATDTARFYYINKIHPGFKDNAKTIIADRIIALICLIILSLTCLVSYLKNWSIIQYAFCSLFLFVVLIIVASNVKGIKKIPKRAYVISYFTFNLKAFAFLTIILFLNSGRAMNSDFYLAMLGQIFDAVPLTPANLGVGHFVYDLIYNLESHARGAVIFNYYFLSNIVVKFSGIIAWASIRL